MGPVEKVSRISQAQAVDVHGHYGTYKSHDRGISDGFMSAGIGTTIARASQANVRLTIVSPLRALLPRNGADPIAGNREAAQALGGRMEARQWVVVDPGTPSTFDHADEMLASPWCVGIKIHPEEHGYQIAREGRRLFEFAARHRAVVITHSGEQNSRPEEFVPFADDFPEVKLILAHLGRSVDGDPTHQVRAVSAAKHENVFVDTSSAQSIMPNLIEWAVREIGATRILFGTDTPCYFVAMQRARIDHAEITEAEKRQILFLNAQNLLNLKRQ